MGSMIGSEVSSTHGIGSSTEERALNLLGSGVSMEATASACGVSVSRISQLLSSEEFAGKVAALRYEALQKHNKQDAELDSLESLLTDKFKESIPLMMRPMEILKGLQVINAAKRRGSERVEAVEAKAKVVNIVLPSVIVNNFTKDAITTNIHNQVVSISANDGNGMMDLTTIQSNSLLNEYKKEQQAQLTTESISNEDSKPRAIQRHKVDRSPENI